ncbi:PadR family transcriptional regulator [Microlunatus capsulatus]
MRSDYSCESSCVSSIRLFVLDALARRGDMHGHQLRLLAEEEHAHLWTDISVGALYGALKRLAAEGLLAEVRTEREGGYPERQVYGVTDAGRQALAALQAATLEHVVLKPDPVDLALSRPDPDRLDDLAGTLAARLSTLQDLLAESRARTARARPYLSVGETHALLHREHRIRAEIGWHESLLAAVPEIVADERARALRPDALPTAEDLAARRRATPAGPPEGPRP